MSERLLGAESMSDALFVRRGLKRPMSWSDRSPFTGDFFHASMPGTMPFSSHDLDFRSGCAIHVELGELFIRV